MPSTGPRFPGTTASLANAGTSENAEAWVSTGNIVSDNASEAQITAATYDNNNISQILVASNFTFAIPDGDTIQGITVEIDRRVIAGSAADFRVQLAKGTAFANLVGNNKASASAWPGTTAVATYGGATDLWGTTWTEAEIESANFAVFLSVQATSNNVDIGVDFIRVTVHHANPQTATPAAATIAITGEVPTVTATQHRLVTPAAASIVITGNAPTVSTPVVVTPAAGSIVITGSAPTVTIGVRVEPAAASIVLTGHAPTVSAPRLVTPAAASIGITGHALTVSTPVVVRPDAATIVITGDVPTIVIEGTGDPVVVTPDAATISITGHAPTVTVIDADDIEVLLLLAALTQGGREPARKRRR